ncbi:MAG: lipopolysaccharide heptosyltransferase II [Deltaproteobacteria bacterium]
MDRTPQGVKTVLFVTMSNLGDALMGLPAFDYLRRTFPEARITVVAAPRTKAIFADRPDVERLIVFDKHAPAADRRRLFFSLRRERFDVIVDLKNSFFRWGLAARYKNPAWVRMPAWIKHSHEEHLYKALAAVGRGRVSREEFAAIDAKRNPSFIRTQDYGAVNALLAQCGVPPDAPFAVIAPGARSDLKKWHASGYAEVARELHARHGLRVLVVGDGGDRAVVERVTQEAGRGAAALVGRTDISRLAALVLRARFVVCNDSGVLHLASYLGVPVIGIYGPSNEVRYGPWSASSFVVRKHVACAPCESAHCRRGRECIETIRPFDVLLAARLLLEGEADRVRRTKYKRILVSRTDRIGDVLLSTPALQALRMHYPTSYIAVLVSPYTRLLVEGNPYIDEVICLDKDVRHRGFRLTWGLAQALRRKNFDVAVILHPTLRVHLVCFLAGIRERIGYDRKGAYLLTRTLPHKKQEGRKHEMEYNFDLLKLLGVREVTRSLYMPIRPEAERYVEERLAAAGVRSADVLVAVNPAASDLSRRWATAKFAALIDRLAVLPGVRVVVIAHETHAAVTQELLGLVRVSVIDFTGAFGLDHLASLFKRCQLVVSNDSGPVHLAVAVKTPVIAIFGRNQAGLSPRRWGPLGPRDVTIHKKTDCRPCLAHECERGFQCLEAVMVEEVFGHARAILGK